MTSRRVLALAVIASMLLQGQQVTVVEAFTTEAARIDDSGQNLVSDWRFPPPAQAGEPTVGGCHLRRRPLIRGDTPQAGPMDETAIASELPHVRALASGGEAPRDRIFVRDYTRSVEIGAFSTERGVTQRIRFNVVIEVSHTAAAEVDDVDKVLSYDSLTEAIETELARERINLLETLAERVARRCLSDPRAVCAFVRVEKLDRIPGALGVEIVRTRSDDVPRVPPATVLPEAASRPLVLFLPNRVLLGAEGGRWRDAAAGPPRAAILALEPVSPQPPAAGPAALRAGLLAVEQNAWTLAAVDGRFVVAASRTEIDWALGAGQPTVWAPTKLVADAVSRERLDASAPLGLARWLAAELGAEHVLAVGTGENSPSLTVLDPGAPERLGDFV